MDAGPVQNARMVQRQSGPDSRKSASTARRRPRQSRALQTSHALQEAFVRLLEERDYGAITIREIALVAGTGLGSFYEYFASKEDLARVCLHMRSKALLAILRDAAQADAGASMASMAGTIVDAMVEAHRAHPAQWGSHYLLERHLSGAEAYRRMYERFVDAWAAALAAADDAPPPPRLRELARVGHTVLYGMFAHAFIGAVGRPDLQALAPQSRLALHGVLRQDPRG